MSWQANKVHNDHRSYCDRCARTVMVCYALLKSREKRRRVVHLFRESLAVI
jgi:hypothetical protein